MPHALEPYVDLARDAGLALTDAGYAYGLLVSGVGLLTAAGLLVLLGLIATHGRSHGTRFSAMAVFCFAALAGGGAWLLRPDAAAGTVLAGLLSWSWAPPLAAAFALLATMAPKPGTRALGLGFATLAALLATVFGGMLSVANARVLSPDSYTWLDAPAEVMQTQAEDEPASPRPVLDTAAHRRYSK